jgi:hypothetical protein
MKSKGAGSNTRQEGEEMFRTLASISLLVGTAALSATSLDAQFSFSVAGRPVQFHSFLSQDFLATDQNNYLTMDTAHGSFAFTEMGVNASMQLTDRLHIGAQFYDRNVGSLGQWEPQLDWAVVDYKFRDWFGVRAGKVKTVMGLDNDTQDMDFLHTFALLPQSVYPLDLHDATIAHAGGDVYGDVSMGRLGGLSYTAFVGHRSDSVNGGYLYLLRDRGINMTSYGGLQYGADVRWNTPVKGFLVGVSRMNEDITGSGTAACPPGEPFSCDVFNPNGGQGVRGPYQEHSRKDWINQFYGEYTIGNLSFDSEYRRYYRDQIAWNNLLDVWSDNRGWYIAASYRISTRVAVGSYYSDLSTLDKRGPFPASLDPDLPGNHIRDKVITCRIDLTRFWNLKAEGHFMDGYNNNQYPAGFYTTVNPLGFQRKTTLLVLHTGFNF